MIRLEKSKYYLAYEAYRKEKLFFPLIATVLQDLQDGVVYADNPVSPAQFYVEHSFGFAQIFGETAARFEEGLEGYLLLDSAFEAAKVRLYAPSPPGFLLAKHDKVSVSERQRFKLAETFSLPVNILEELDGEDKVQFLRATDRTVSAINEKFEVVERFWRNESDFIAHSNAVLIQYEGELAAICYSAATADCCAEIDVMTLPDFRKLGLGKFAVLKFIEECIAGGIDPLWDCFTNNVPSMMLAKSIGYLPFEQPYHFYTINR